jgi:hypothetical protein
MPLPDDRTQPRAPSRAPQVAIGTILVIATLGVAGWYWWQNRERPYLPPPAKSEAKAPETSSAPKHPLAAEAGAPLPPLAESDGAMQRALGDIIGSEAVQRFFNFDGLARRIVATVDNLPRETLATRLNPVRPTAGSFATRGKETSLVIAPDNASRYTPLVRVVEHVDAAKAVAVYTRFYPLFQQAYEELGYPGRYFNDRLVETIDDLLDAPEPKGPIALKQPKVLYEYQDPELESRSAGQKIMMRIGTANETIVKAKLREVRQQIVNAAPKR